MRIMNNISAMNAHRLYTANNSKLSKSLEKLSSGYAINRAGDNAAGLAVSEKMRAQIAGLEQASKNAQDGISMVQTYEGALTESDSILQRMRSLAVQSANGTYDNSVDRVAIEQEFKQLNDELNQIADTDFNGVIVLNGGQMADGAVKNAKGVIDYNNQVRQATDIGSTNLMGTVDDSMYTKDAADKLWEATGTADTTDTLEVTFTYTSEGWKSGTTGVTVTETENGGFTVQADGTDVAKTVFDNSDKVVGDTITLSFTGGKAKTQAPSQFAVTDDTFNDEKNTKIQAPVGTVTVTADKIDANAGKALATLESGVNISTTLKADGTLDTGSKVSVAGTPLSDTTTTWTRIGDVNSTLFAKYEDGTITFGSLKDGATTGTSLTDDTNVTTLATMQLKTATTAADAASAKLDFTAQLDKPKYNGVDAYNVEVVKSQNPVSVSNAKDASTAKLTYSEGMTLQVGSRTKDLVNFTFAYDADSIGTLKADLDCSARGLGTDKLSLATQEDANAAIDKIDHAINKVSMVRGTFGAIQNRLEHKINNLDTNHENLSAAESRIRDTDMAAEMMEFTKNQILSQASQSMLAQANQLPQGVLSLLQ